MDKFILAIETSGRLGSVAVMRNDEIVSFLVSGVQRTHSERLMPVIDSVMRLSGIKNEQLDAIAVSIGPGSFTGLRIGVGTAQGLATALDIQVIPIETTLALSHNIPGSESPVRVIMVSRKNELYTAEFRWRDEGFERLTPDRAETPEQVVAAIQERTVFIGDGVPKWGKFFKSILGEDFVTIPPICNLPRAEIVGYLGFNAMQKGAAVDPSLVTPKYVREPTPVVKKRLESSKHFGGCQ